jgi:spore maturation protein A
MNILWGGIILFSLFYGLITGRGNTLAEVILEIPKETLTLSITVIGSAIMWSGFMKIMEEAGVITKLSQLFRPLMRVIFPKLKDEKALNYISTNISANLFGLGFAATPSGLLGMRRLSEISEVDKTVASDDMVTFLVLNTAGVTLVPTTVLALRESLGSNNPADFMFIGLIGTVLSCVGGIVIERLLRRPIK